MALRIRAALVGGSGHPGGGRQSRPCTVAAGSHWPKVGRCTSVHNIGASAAATAPLAATTDALAALAVNAAPPPCRAAATGNQAADGATAASTPGQFTTASHVPTSGDAAARCIASLTTGCAARAPIAAKLATAARAYLDTSPALDDRTAARAVEAAAAVRSDCAAAAAAARAGALGHGARAATRS